MARCWLKKRLRAVDAVHIFSRDLDSLKRLAFLCHADRIRAFKLHPGEDRPGGSVQCDVHKRVVMADNRADLERAVTAVDEFQQGDGGITGQVRKAGHPGIRAGC